jgi:hypothetical protein
MHAIEVLHRLPYGFGMELQAVFRKPGRHYHEYISLNGVAHVRGHSGTDQAIAKTFMYHWTHSIHSVAKRNIQKATITMENATCRWRAQK